MEAGLENADVPHASHHLDRHLRVLYNPAAARLKTVEQIRHSSGEQLDVNVARSDCTKLRYEC